MVLSWAEILSDESKIGLHVAADATWNETAYFADLVLPMGHASERHDLNSYETHSARPGSLFGNPFCHGQRACGAAGAVHLRG